MSVMIWNVGWPTMVVTIAWLFAMFGSYSLATTPTTFWRAPMFCAVTTIVAVAVPDASVPRRHVTVPWLFVQLGVPDTYVTPDGRMSVRVTPVAPPTGTTTDRV